MNWVGDRGLGDIWLAVGVLVLLDLLRMYVVDFFSRDRREERALIPAFDRAQSGCLILLTTPLWLLLAWFGGAFAILCWPAVLIFSIFKHRSRRLRRQIYSQGSRASQVRQEVLKAATAAGISPADVDTSVDAIEWDLAADEHVDRYLGAAFDRGGFLFGDVWLTSQRVIHTVGGVRIPLDSITSVTVDGYSVAVQADGGHTMMATFGKDSVSHDALGSPVRKTDGAAQSMARAAAAAIEVARAGRRRA